MSEKRLKRVTNDYIQGGDWLDPEVTSGTRTVSWNDENGGPQVTYQPVPKFNALKARYFYRYLSQGFMKQYKNYIKLYNTIVELIIKG